jgi:hypothetical protein
MNPQNLSPSELQDVGGGSWLGTASRVATVFVASAVATALCPVIASGAAGVAAGYGFAAAESDAYGAITSGGD